MNEHEQQPENPSQELTIRRNPDVDSTGTDNQADNTSIEQSAVVEDVQRLLFTPPIDIYNTEEGLVLRADLPGVTVERLELQIEDNKLTLFGRVESVIPENAKLLHAEYQVGDFYRSFILSDEVDYERISAKMNHGVLEITLPKIPRTKTRKIQVHID